MKWLQRFAIACSIVVIALLAIPLGGCDGLEECIDASGPTCPTDVGRIDGNGVINSGHFQKIESTDANGNKTVRGICCYVIYDRGGNF